MNWYEIDFKDGYSNKRHHCCLKGADKGSIIKRFERDFPEFKLIKVRLMGMKK